MALCEIPGCGLVHDFKVTGLCPLHVQRWIDRPIFVSDYEGFKEREARIILHLRGQTSLWKDWT